MSANIQSNSEFQRTISESFKSDLFSTFALTNRLQFVDYPNHEVIAERITKHIRVEFIPVDAFYSKNKPFVHQIKIKGLPNGMEEDFWELVLLDDSIPFYSGTPSIIESRREENHKILTIQGNPNEDYFDESNQSLDIAQLSYKLKSISSINNKHLNLGPIKIPIKISRDPQFSISDIKHVPQKNNDMIKQNWKVKLKMKDEPEIVNKDFGFKISAVDISKGDQKLDLEFNDNLMDFPRSGDILEVEFEDKTPIPEDGVKDVYNLVITIQTRNDLGNVIERSIKEKIEVLRRKGESEPKVNYNLISSDNGEVDFTWNFLMEIKEGDEEINLSIAPTILQFKMSDIITGNTITNQRNLVPNQEDGKYFLDIKSNKENQTDLKTLVRDVRVTSAVTLELVNGDFVPVKTEKEIPLKVPYNPSIDVIELKAENTNNVMSWNGGFHMNDNLELFNDQTQISIIRSELNAGKTLLLTPIMVKESNHDYTLSLKFPEDISLDLNVEEEQTILIELLVKDLLNEEFTVEKEIKVLGPKIMQGNAVSNLLKKLGG